jgi:glycerol transport system ATP-binding protein
MAGIILDSIAHTYGEPSDSSSDYALQPINHTWEDGGAYALLGPSGCGKTTLLNIISGLLTPSQGRVIFDNTDVTNLPTERRNIAQVFQFPVVYDNMTVAENLDFPLRNQNLPKAERNRRVADVLDMLDLQDVAHSRARNLGADARQKVSLARGLVRTDANAILFDEPLTVIDPELKWQLRAQLKKVHQQFQHTMIYVTHDQTEALTFADKVVVMREGEILQIGTPEELFNTPRHTFVGRFIGSPGMNILPCTVQGKSARIGPHQVALNHDYPITDGGLELGIRPEYIDLVERDSTPHALPVTIESVNDLGRYRIVSVLLEQHALKVLVPEGPPLPTAAAIVLQQEQVRLYRDSVLIDGHLMGGRS